MRCSYVAPFKLWVACCLRCGVPPPSRPASQIQNPATPFPVLALLGGCRWRCPSRPCACTDVVPLARKYQPHQKHLPDEVGCPAPTFTLSQSQSCSSIAFCSNFLSHILVLAKISFLTLAPNPATFASHHSLAERAEPGQFLLITRTWRSRTCISDRSKPSPLLPRRQFVEGTTTAARCRTYDAVTH